MSATDKNFAWVDFLLENQLNFTIIDSRTCQSLLKNVCKINQAPTSEDFETSILAKRHQSYIERCLALTYSNFITVHVNRDNNKCSAISFANSIDRVKVFLKLETYENDHYINFNLEVFCKESIIKMYDIYGKIINFVIYEAKYSNFLRVSDKISAIVDNTNFDTTFYRIPCFSTICAYLKTIRLTDNIEQENLYNERIKKLEAEISSLKTFEVTEKILKLIDENVINITDFNDTNLIEYLNCAALATNFVSPHHKGHRYVEQYELYNKMMNVFTENLNKEEFDIFSFYVSEDNVFRFLFSQKDSADAVTFWKKAKVSHNGTQALKRLCDFAIDLLELPCVISIDIDFDKLLEYKNNQFTRKYLNLVSNLVFSE